MTYIDELIANPDNPIVIVSGEGDYGTVEEYTGKRTMRAIKARLTRKRCGGDRWVFAQVYDPGQHNAGIEFSGETNEMGELICDTTTWRGEEVEIDD